MLRPYNGGIPLLRLCWQVKFPSSSIVREKLGLEQDETVTNSYGNSFRTAGGAKFPQD